METPKFINNTTERVVDDLKLRLKEGSRVAVAAASFSIYAYEVLKEELEQIEELRFIFTSPTFTRDKVQKEKREFFIPKLNRERSLYGTDFEIRLRNQLSQKAIARECADWIRRKASFKSNSSHDTMGGFLHLQNPSEMVYQPFYDFTTTQLGVERGNEVYSMVNVMPGAIAQQYLKIFNEQWDNCEKFHDVTSAILEHIESVYQENAPEYIYFISLYNIFNEFLEDISEDVLPNERTGFKNSAIWSKLYNFQRDAALSIINKLEKFNGCILADSVGLGKTFTALSVIKYYENRNKNVLVLCPKKLHDNWATFRSNYKNNPVLADRLRYDILFHSDLSRDRGISNGLDLKHINWGNYDLIVIDESHNFRNGGNVDETDDDEAYDGDKKENRYQRLMNKVIRSGVKTKVLMLSATPVNNRFLDLKNQLQLAYEGRADDFDEALGLDKGIEEVFRNAQTCYNKWAKLPDEERTTERLLDELNFDFFQLLDSVTIARSRSHIVKYYDTSAIGKFPTRLKPVSRRPKLTDLGQHQTATFTHIATTLQLLSLAVYTPSAFIQPSARDRYDLQNDEKGRLTVGGREMGVRKLMAINLLKRLESSVNSFRLSVERIVELMGRKLSEVEAYLKTREHSLMMAAEAFVPYGMDDEDVPMIATRKLEIDLADMDLTSWRREMQADKKLLEGLLVLIERVTPQHDAKLQTLLADLKDKFANPINAGNRKVLIFTAFADTADYLYSNLAPLVWEQCGLHTALITGNTQGKSTIPGLAADFNTVLSYFSPLSKDRSAIYPKAKEEIDVLIATDCISEGQNLQDCDFLINYDIHWNPVRIIQRFGRIDRIGSKNNVIQLVNYWPDMELDDYIKLKGRVESRMKATVLTSTGDDDLLSDNEKGDLKYRREQLLRLQKEVVDVEDMDTGINIMDLGLNEFRLDLLQYMQQHPDVEHAPFGMSAVVQSSPHVKPGVIFVLKNRNNAVNIEKKNLLHPFYMVYIGADGQVVADHLHPKQLLDAMRLACRDHSAPISELCAKVNAETKDGRDMGRYNELLQQAISSIITVKAESDIDSLFSLGETTALRGEIHGLDDFELVSFLIVK